MMAAKIDNAVNRAAKAGALLLAGWLGCSAWYGTMDLHLKAKKLETVQAVVIPQLQTALNQATCDKGQFKHVAAESIAAQDAPDLPAPDWKDLHGCPKVVPVKPPPNLAAKN